MNRFFGIRVIATQKLHFRSTLFMMMKTLRLKKYLMKKNLKTLLKRAKRPLVLLILILLVVLILAVAVGLIALVVWAVIAIIHAISGTAMLGLLFS